MTFSLRQDTAYAVHVDDSIASDASTMFRLNSAKGRARGSITSLWPIGAYPLYIRSRTSYEAIVGRCSLRVPYVPPRHRVPRSACMR